MIKVDLIHYLKARRKELESDIQVLNLPGYECIKESRQLKHIGAIGEIDKIIKLLKE